MVSLTISSTGDGLPARLLRAGAASVFVSVADLLNPRGHRDLLRDHLELLEAEAAADVDADWGSQGVG